MDVTRSSALNPFYAYIATIAFLPFFCRLQAQTARAPTGAGV